MGKQPIHSDLDLRVTWTVITLSCFLLLWHTYYFKKDKANIAISYEKINQNGEFLPFFGYTSLSMCKNNQGLEKIEDFIKTSPVISKYFSALPHESYHATFFNIWNVGDEPISVVQRWTGRGEELPHNVLLADTVPQDKLLRARQACEKYINTGFEVTWKWYKLPSYVMLTVTPDAHVSERIKQFRSKCSDIFNHDDSILDDMGFHITLAYGYHALFDKDKAELMAEFKQLNNLILREVGAKIKLEAADIYWFDSMEHYWKFEPS